MVAEKVGIGFVPVGYGTGFVPCETMELEPDGYGTLLDAEGYGRYPDPDPEGYGL